MKEVFFLLSFFITGTRERELYIYTIPPPRSLLEILVDSKGGGGVLKRTVLSRCRATLTHSRSPAANFMRHMFHPCSAAQGRGGSGGVPPGSVLGVIMSPSCNRLPPTVSKSHTILK